VTDGVLFCNCDKFDLIAIYNDAPEMPGPPDAPIPRLIRAIYGTAFRIILKCVPVLLIGGLEAWTREFGDQELVVESAPAAPVPVTTWHYQSIHQSIMEAAPHIASFFFFYILTSVSPTCIVPYTGTAFLTWGYLRATLVSVAPESLPRRTKQRAITELSCTCSCI
jgi:hypothetical protein